MSTRPTVSEPRTTPREDGWALPDESVRRPALVKAARERARLTMQQIDDGWVLPAEPARSIPTAAPVAAPATGKLDLNRATLDELQGLPGVGRLRAKRILSLRDDLGGFKAVADLSAVRGVGAKTLRQLEALVAVY